MARARSKKLVKKALKFVAPAVDYVFSYSGIKNPATRVANLFVSRYAKYGEEVKSVTPRPYQGPWHFELDTPKIAKSITRKTYVSGWIVPFDENESIQMRIQTPSKDFISLDYGIDRSDVAAILRTRYRRKINDKCGFGASISIDADGPYTIEIKLKNSWLQVARIELSYDPDYLPRDLFNAPMAKNMAEHLHVIDVKRRYFSEKESKHSYNLDSKLDPKLVAFYLPQFHPFPENDEWWGKGFTEWTNVSSATPRFVGHEQPKLPTDLGYYDLRYEDNIKAQIDLAKKYGVSGFCFYYYWFSGRRLLASPLESFLSHQEWDFNFMICWANENWTRRWDGRQQDVLIAQQHRPEDPLAFIQDVESTLLDKRYIRVDGKPVLMVYRANDLGKTSEYAEVWRKYFRDKHNLGLHLVAVQSFSSEDPSIYGFDKGLEFVPLSIPSTLGKPIDSYNISSQMLDNQYTGVVYDYRTIALTLPDISTSVPVYRSVMPRWDNDARKKGGGGVFQGANPDLYGRWLDKLIDQTSDLSDRLVFINAWNEWAEGAYLEPDSMYGHSFLNRTAEVLAKHSPNLANAKYFPMYGLTRDSKVKLAVIIHTIFMTKCGQCSRRGCKR